LLPSASGSIPGMLEARALVLNRSWTPISTTSVRRAITLVVRGAAGVVDPETCEVDGFEGWVKTSASAVGTATIRGYEVVLRVPEVIVLRKYDGYPVRGVAFTRRNVYRRDGFSCMYCGRRPGLSDLTIDHVVPRSRGGKSTWENCVTACRGCNARKANRHTNEVGFHLARTPSAPRWPGGLDPASIRARPAWHRFVPASALAVGA
jgi:5-methylcytosine-specific restriction endonuclease McrA